MNILNDNKEIIVRYFEEVWNKGDVEVLDELLSDDYVNHNPGLENPVPGPEGLKPIVSAIRKGFPDLKYSIEKMVIADDHVAIHTIMMGTHTGVLFGMPATGKKVRVPQMQIERIYQGKMIEHWRVTDDLGMLKQIGQLD